jgi:hypothetical protein
MYNKNILVVIQLNLLSQILTTERTEYIKQYKVSPKRWFQINYSA